MTSPSSIPAEAVEAAAKALYFYLDEDHRGAPDPWESIAEDDEAKIDAKEAARIALEAAAPHILAGAWEAGCKKGLSTNPGWDEVALDANPYRPTP